MPLCPCYSPESNRPHHLLRVNSDKQILAAFGRLRNGVTEQSRYIYFNIPNNQEVWDTFIYGVIPLISGVTMIVSYEVPCRTWQFDKSGTRGGGEMHFFLYTVAVWGESYGYNVQTGRRNLKILSCS